MLNIAELDKNKNIVYMDYAASTPVDKNILDAILALSLHPYGNASSMHRYGRNAKKIIDESRERISKYLNCSPKEIIFTGSGTESDNMAIIGIARANRIHGNHIIISSIEHKAIIESAKILEKEGFEISILPVNKDGMINIDKCLSLVKKETILISIMYANNEIGTIQPIKKLASKLRGLSSPFPLLHTDACQTVGYLDIDVKDLGIDLMSVNSSKIYGPKGVGLLYKREGVKISPLINGGEQENNLRAGTENISLIYGFSLALEKACLNRSKESKRLENLRDYFIKNIEKKIPEIKLNGHRTNRLPNNIHFSIPRIEGESMVLMLDNYGIMAATGSACSTFDLKPSHVLSAIGQDERIMHGSIRFTLGRDTNRKKIDYVLKIFPKVVEQLKKISPIK